MANLSHYIYSIYFLAGDGQPTAENTVASWKDGEMTVINLKFLDGVQF